MPDDQSAYFRQREQRERLLAQTASEPSASLIHRELADRYAALLDGEIYRPAIPLPAG